MTVTGILQAVSGALKAAGLTDYSIHVAEQKVVVLTDRNSDEVKETIEKTGKVAVLVGAGGAGGILYCTVLYCTVPYCTVLYCTVGVLGAGVAMLGVGGDYFSPGPKGVIRLTQLMSGCVIEGTVDGLSPGQHGLAIHETGDTSQAQI